MSWSEVAAAFHTSWDNVFRSRLEWRDLRGIKALGVDEIQWQRGHH